VVNPIADEEDEEGEEDEVFALDSEADLQQHLKAKNLKTFFATDPKLQPVALSLRGIFIVPVNDCGYVDLEVDLRLNLTAEKVHHPPAAAGRRGV
jgi:hypothetical protein